MKIVVNVGGDKHTNCEIETKKLKITYKNKYNWLLLGEKK